MILYLKDQLTVLFLSIKQNMTPKFTSMVCISETYRLKVVSHAADFSAFLIHKVVCF